MIKNFDEFINEKNTYGDLGKFMLKNKKNELKYKEFFKKRVEEKNKKEREEFENLKKYEKYFKENNVEKINNKDLKDVLSDISKYLKEFKTPINSFIKNNNIDDEFFNMAYNIDKLYLPDISKEKMDFESYLEKDDVNKVRIFHQSIIKYFLGIKNVFETADKEHEEIVKTFYKYLMFVDRRYYIWEF